MEIFDRHGHLTEQALAALSGHAPLDELARLEMAEHLAFCDRCLQQYTELLAGDALLSPSPSCRKELMGRIRRRAVRLFTSRYATAAAAVALALTLLWGGSPGRQTTDRPRPLEQAGQTMAEWAFSWPQDFQELFSDLDGLFDFLGSGPSTTQGGTQP